MDAYSGYNQILMAKEDEEKTSFVTDWGMSCTHVVWDKKCGRNVLETD